MTPRPNFLIAIAVAIAAVGGTAKAADIKVLAAGAMKSVVVALAPEFEKQTGHHLSIDNGTSGALSKRIGDGEAFDVAIITPAVIDDLAKRGKISTGSRTDIAKVGIGVAIKTGAAVPDIGTTDAFKRILLSAKSIGYIDPAAGGSSGIYFDRLLDKLGIGEQVRAKATLKRGGYVAELVANGEVELCIHQISEILPVPGVSLVGPLPPDLQNYTVYAAGLGAAATDTTAAKALIGYLGSDAAKATLRAKGMETP